MLVVYRCQARELLLRGVTSIWNEVCTAKVTQGACHGAPWSHTEWSVAYLFVCSVYTEIGSYHKRNLSFAASTSLQEWILFIFSLHCYKMTSGQGYYKWMLHLWVLSDARGGISIRSDVKIWTWICVGLFRQFPGSFRFGNNRNRPLPLQSISMRSLVWDRKGQKRYSFIYIKQSIRVCIYGTCSLKVLAVLTHTPR